MSKFRSISILVIMVICVAQAAGITLEELKVAYQTQVLRVSEDKENSLDQLRKSYLKSLEKIKVDFQKAGRLQDVLLVQQEEESIGRKLWPLPALKSDAPMKLKRGRKLYDKAHLERSRNAARQYVSTASKMEAALEVQIVELTKAGKIEEAMDAKKLLQKTKLDPALKDAIDLIARAGRDGSGPPAYRIRRYGDGIEVIVSYDKQGKVSLDSPVENVIEITGGKSEKGSTTAKVLGEFVGAKGYEPAPWTIYQNDFKNGKLGSFVLTDIEAKANAKADDGESGLRLTLSAGAKNPNGAMGETLPPLSESGKYMVTCSYLIPGGNREIVGFQWHQGFGAPIENFTFDTKGRWVTKSISSISLNELHHLRMYFQFKKGSTLADAAGESIFLKDLKVEQQSFSTYIVARFNKDGGIEASFPSPKDQKKLTLAGSLVKE